METGFLVDSNQAVFLQARWIAGSPERGWLGGVKVDRTELRPITTYRCPNCGYLESYAK
jgi:hypothetical protein